VLGKKGNELNAQKTCTFSEQFIFSHYGKFLPQPKLPFPRRSQGKDMTSEGRMELQKLAENSHLQSPDIGTSLPAAPESCTALFPMLSSRYAQQAA